MIHFYPSCRFSNRVYLALSLFAVTPTKLLAKPATSAFTLSSTQSAITELYETYVDPHAGEFRLDMDLLELPDHANGMVAAAALSVLTSASSKGIDSLAVKEWPASPTESRTRWEKIVEYLSKTNKNELPYFCRRFLGIEHELDSDAICKSQLRSLLEPLANDGRTQIITVASEGDYYGSFRRISLFIGQYEAGSQAWQDLHVGRYIRLNFDIAHDL